MVPACPTFLEIFCTRCLLSLWLRFKKKKKSPCFSCSQSIRLSTHVRLSCGCELVNDRLPSEVRGEGGTAKTDPCMAKGVVVHVNQSLSWPCATSCSYTAGKQRTRLSPQRSARSCLLQQWIQIRGNDFFHTTFISRFEHMKQDIHVSSTPIADWFRG